MSFNGFFFVVVVFLFFALVAILFSGAEHF